MKRPIGILGGMGPEASVHLYELLITLAITKFEAKNNDDFPEIILQSIPVPDFISSDKDKKKALHMLQKRTKLLESLQPKCLAIACNTAHLLLPQLQEISFIPFVSMVEEVVKEVQKQKIKKIGILGTPSTIRSRLYQTALARQNIQSVVPTDEQLDALESVIRHIIAKKNTERDEEVLVQISKNLVDQGAEGVLLGCTELPLIFPTRHVIPVFNSLVILAEKLLNVYYEKKGIYDRGF